LNSDAEFIFGAGHTLHSARESLEPSIIEGRNARAGYRRFLDSCSTGDSFRLTPRAEPTAYALCFGIFGLHLLGEIDFMRDRHEAWNHMLRHNLEIARNERSKVAPLHRDKAYLQLLTFTLSALRILGTLQRDPVEGYVREVLPGNIEAELEQTGALRGIARSGNHAMFLAVLLLHARDYLGLNTQAQLDAWVSLHLDAINPLGFWGSQRSMSHLQFQNGYHQYEILEYLRIRQTPWERAAESVSSLADDRGHYAPYPGGGGCYDYDAIFILTGAGAPTVARHRELLLKTARSIVSEQNDDGGFAESRCVSPLSLETVSDIVRHGWRARGAARFERLRLGLGLLRPKNRRIHTHWSHYSREWGESDLWDSWFRMLTLARIEVALDPPSVTAWGFIDYPGIGFHHLAGRSGAAF
jgi:hypothetical protein